MTVFIERNLQRNIRICVQITVNIKKNKTHQRKNSINYITAVSTSIDRKIIGKIAPSLCPVVVVDNCKSNKIC